MSDDILSIGEWIARRRASLGLTQKELADKIAISPSHLKKIEQGERSLTYEIQTGLIRGLYIPYEHLPFIEKLYKQGYISEAEARWIALPRKKISPPLPTRIGSFYGRGQELAQIKAFLQTESNPIVALTGFAGVGKTRLALEVAYQLQEEYSDGIFFVGLDNCDSHQDVAAAFIKQIAPQRQVANPLKALSYLLSNKNLLIILDALEQITDATTLISDWLTYSSELKILVTSRESPAIMGIPELRIDPLPLPQSNLIPDIVNNPAIQLLVDQFRTYRTGFEINDTNKNDIIELVRSVDGIPLALQLLAWHHKNFSLKELLLGHQSNVIPRVAGITRYRSIDAAIATSYNLLSELEAKVLRFLSVFPNGVTYEMGVDLERLAGFKITEPIQLLTLKNFVQPIEENGKNTRYKMLKVMRTFGLACLKQIGEEQIAYQLLVHLVQSIAVQKEVESIEVWYLRVDEEMPAIREALRYLYEAKKPEVGCEILEALARYWDIHHAFQEGHGWFAKFLSNPIHISSIVLSKTYETFAVLAYRCGNYEDGLRAITLGKSAMEVIDKVRLASYLNTEGLILSACGNPEQAMICFCRALEIIQESKRFKESELPTLRLYLLIANNVAWHLREHFHEPRQAYALFENGLKMAALIQDDDAAAFMYHGMGGAQYMLGNYERSRSLFVRSLGLWGQRQNNYQGIIWSLEGLIDVYLSESNFQQALWFCVLSSVMRAELGLIRHIGDVETHRYKMAEEQVHTILGHEAWENAWREASLLPVTHISQMVLSTLYDPPR